MRHPSKERACVLAVGRRLVQADEQTVEVLHVLRIRDEGRADLHGRFLVSASTLPTVRLGAR
jgi:hypothetical protein